MNPEISIIIVNYNTLSLTLKCVDSILKSNPKIPFEIIVVDNGSSDGSGEALKKIEGGKVRIILHKQNLGFAKGNNSGIKKARGTYIFLLNSDTEVKRGAIEVLYEFAKHTPNVGLVAPMLLNPDLSIQASVFRFPTLGRTIKQYWFGKKALLDKYYPKASKPTKVEAVVAAAVLITPAAIKKVGLLDERYFMYFEDLEYCKNVWKNGLEIYYHPLAQVIHHHGASGKNTADANNQWRRLIPSSKIYHGLLKHWAISFVIRTGSFLK